MSLTDTGLKLPKCQIRQHMPSSVLVAQYFFDYKHNLQFGEAGNCALSPPGGITAVSSIHYREDLPTSARGEPCVHYCSVMPAYITYINYYKCLNSR
ncbi:hypothetical protein Pelo_17466 [Pelomyxa schiedti]|nr:hypothetical protein Pelo_17466 [Pelomyxa schiedti]